MIRATVASGLWPDSSENGLLSLASQVQSLKPNWQIEDHHYQDQVDHPFDVYIGCHSFGGSWCRDQLKKFPDYPVAYIGLIDPVDFHWDESNNFTIPKNVQRADCFKRFLAWFPPSSAILNPSEVYKNYNIWMLHGSAPKNQKVVQTILKSIGSLNI